MRKASWIALCRSGVWNLRCRWSGSWLTTMSGRPGIPSSMCTTGGMVPLLLVARWATRTRHDTSRSYSFSSLATRVRISSSAQADLSILSKPISRGTWRAIANLAYVLDRKRRSTRIVSTERLRNGTVVRGTKLTWLISGGIHATQGDDLLRGYRLGRHARPQPGSPGDAGADRGIGDRRRQSWRRHRARPCARPADHPPQHGPCALS